MKKVIPIVGLLAGLFLGAVWFSGFVGIKTPEEGTATIALAPGSIVYGADNSDNSHIENIYIIENTVTNYAIDFGSNTANVMGVITSSGGTASINYDTRFKIVVAVKGHSDNLAYVTEENIKVEVDSSDLGITPAENSLDADEYPFENSGYGTGTGYVRLNAVWDNNGNGFVLSAGASASLTSVKLWTWS